MKDRRQIFALAAVSAVAALALPTVAAAEYYVPPANSAANQYTESFPGAGGESHGKRKKVTPGTALGTGNAEKLEAKGPAGKAAAEIAAETAPSQLVDQGRDEGDGTAGGNGQADGDSGGQGEGESGSGAPGTGGGNSGNGSSGNAQQPQGSSGFGQVLGQATGVSDGNLGLWLPLAIMLTLIGSVAYWVRMRHAQPGHRV